jgi:general secretion pathway protein D
MKKQPATWPTAVVSVALRRASLACAAAMALVSCASDRPVESATDTPVPLVVEEAPQPAALPGPESAQAPDRREEIVERGTGAFIGTASGRATGDSTPGEIDLRFDGADMREFVRAVLGDLLGVNYLIDTAVTGTVTLQTTRPIREEELLPLFEQILAANNAVLVRDGTLYQVLPRAATAGRADLVTGRDTSAGIRTQVIPLRFIAAAEMQRILESVVADPSALRTDTARNLVIVSGTAADVQAVQDAIGIFDVDWLRGMSLGLYPLDNVDPATLEGELTRVLSATAGQDDSSPLGGIVRLVPLERLTSLLVVSSTPAGLREVEVWIRRLDQPGESAGQRLYVYPVQNAKATELADVLGNIFQSRASARADAPPSAASNASSGARMGGVAPGLTPVQIGPRPASPGATTTPSAAAAGTESSDGVALVDGGSLEIIADDVRNALVILGTPEQYRMVESAIRKLDVVPLQVLIEARILEVALRDDLSYGVEWFFQNNNINGGEGRSRGTLDLGSSGIAALAPGFSYTVIDTADNVRLALNLLAEESDVNILSAPSLMVLDNQTATINVGDEIPVPARQSISNIDPNSPTVNEITFRQTGITLSVTPRVSSSGLVTMEVQQEVATAATTTTSNIDAPTIQNRQIDSVVAVNSGETIVLGGLMRTQQSQTESGVPGLRRIPGIGKLFSATNNEESRTELLVLITPRVVRNRDDVRSITEEFRQKLPRLQKLEAEMAPKSEG